MARALSALLVISATNGCLLDEPGEADVEVTAGEEPLGSGASVVIPTTCRSVDAYDIFRLTMERTHNEKPVLIAGPPTPARPGSFEQQRFQLTKSPYGQQARWQYWTTSTTRSISSWQVKKLTAITRRQVVATATDWYTTWGSIDCDCSRGAQGICKYTRFPEGW